MPKVVDHEARRRALGTALVEVALRDGLHAVSMRSVAAAAGVSLGQVQHYVASKADLVQLALAQLEADSHARWAARLADLPEPPPPRRLLEAFVDEALPDDDGSRRFHQLFLAASVLGMTDAQLRREDLLAGPDRLEAQLTEAVGRAQWSGEIAADRDPAVVAAALVTMTHGLGTSVLLGQRTPAAARAVLTDHLDRLFAPGGR